MPNDAEVTLYPRARLVAAYAIGFVVGIIVCAFILGEALESREREAVVFIPLTPARPPAPADPHAPARPRTRPHVVES